ncbi:hypothetical protein CNR22_21100 [Sphingobacteriaceae bacterium]|nr:hypothetical protein CNR22_21100 [Sphingobacteriaceae bacterium]
MNINFEKTPNTVFDWAEKLSYTELSNLQKKQVLLYMSEEDYTGIYETSKGVKILLKRAPEVANTGRKNALLNHFDVNYSRKKQARFKTIIAWQAAAVILMLISGWLFYRVFDLQKADSVLQVASTDTVYVTKEISAEPEHIHDTVYLYKESAKSAFKENSVIDSSQSAISGKLNTLESLPVVEQKNVSGLPKGNSMKDDSLLKKFGFVAM